MNKKELKTLKRKKKLAQRQHKVKQSARLTHQPIACAICLDCNEFCYAHEHYLVTNDCWKEAGFDGWYNGYLHLPSVGITSALAERTNLG